MKLFKVNQGCVDIEYLVLGPIDNNSYIISDGQATLVVDPSYDAKAILAALNGRACDAIVLTHNHDDHFDAAAELKRATKAPVIAHKIDAQRIKRPVPEGGWPAAPACPVDREVAEGDELKIGNMVWKVLHTPGHTKGGMCLFLDPKHGAAPHKAPVLIAGDTLFCGSIGRTDFEGGNMKEMRASLKRLRTLPADTLVLPGHNSLTTIGAEQHRVFDFYA